MTHTPGPWHINPLFDYSINSEKKHVAMVNVSVRGKECDVDHLEAQANANLIAAAPDLLEACEVALEYLTDKAADQDLDPEGMEAELALLLVQLETEIAKAKGLSPKKG